MKEIVLLGDSLIDWNYTLPYENYGKNGYRTRDVFWLLEEKEEINGEIGVLLVGINDFFTNMSIENSMDYYKKIVEIMENRFDKIVLISLLPTDRKYINEKVALFNRFLEENFSKSFLNIYNYFLDENDKIKKELTTDGIHLKREGYKIFNHYLEEYLAKL